MSVMSAKFHARLVRVVRLKLGIRVPLFKAGGGIFQPFGADAAFVRRYAQRGLGRILLLVVLRPVPRAANKKPERKKQRQRYAKEFFHTIHSLSFFMESRSVVPTVGDRTDAQILPRKRCGRIHLYRARMPFGQVEIVIPEHDALVVCRV